MQHCNFQIRINSKNKGLMLVTFDFDFKVFPWFKSCIADCHYLILNNLLFK